MPFNGSGSFSPPGSSFPAVANTLIEAVKFNAIINDIATNGLSNCVTKDGQTTTTARIPFASGISNGSQTLTAVAAGTATTHAATVGQIQSSAATTLGTVAGTNTITAAGTPAVAAYASGQSFEFTPANTNTGATTINIDSLGEKNIFWNGAACVGGELRQDIPVRIKYDGTQFHIIGNGFAAPFLDTYAVVEGSSDSTKKARFEVDGLTTATTRVYTLPDRDMTIGPVLGTPVATTSGTNIDITGFPVGTRRIVVQFRSVSTNGTSPLILQLGDSGGIENSGYLSGSAPVDGTATQRTDSFDLVNVMVAAQTIEGQFTLCLESPNVAWTAQGIFLQSNTNMYISAGSKVLSSDLDRIRITTASGDTFDSGEINVLYEN